MASQSPLAGQQTARQRRQGEPAAPAEGGPSDDIGAQPRNVSASGLQPSWPLLIGAVLLAVAATLGAVALLSSSATRSAGFTADDEFRALLELAAAAHERLQANQATAGIDSNQAELLAAAAAAHGAGDLLMLRVSELAARVELERARAVPWAQQLATLHELAQAQLQVLQLDEARSTVARMDAIVALFEDSKSAAAAAADKAAVLALRARILECAEEYPDALRLLHAAQQLATSGGHTEGQVTAMLRREYILTIRFRRHLERTDGPASVIIALKGDELRLSAELVQHGPWISRVQMPDALDLALANDERSQPRHDLALYPRAAAVVAAFADQAESLAAHALSGGAVLRLDTDCRHAPLQGEWRRGPVAADRLAPTLQRALADLAGQAFLQIIMPKAWIRPFFADTNEFLTLLVVLSDSSSSGSNNDEACLLVRAANERFALGSAGSAALIDTSFAFEMSSECVTPIVLAEIKFPARSLF
eukprot:m.25654 g.25654  ORF g.25654 m.25654 type:complete len:480 (-) comp4462_c0_seq2:105-1544(-)